MKNFDLSQQDAQVKQESKHWSPNHGKSSTDLTRSQTSRGTAPFVPGLDFQVPVVNFSTISFAIVNRSFVSWLVGYLTALSTQIRSYCAFKVIIWYPYLQTFNLSLFIMTKLNIKITTQSKHLQNLNSYNILIHLTVLQGVS